MRGFRSRAPFAAIATAIVVVASATVVFTLKDVALERNPHSVTRTLGPSSRSPELSATARLAYWRAEPNGGAALWVQNADGSLRRAVAQLENVRRVTRTRWSNDGASLAYVEGGTKAVIVKLDGTRTDLTLPGAVLAEGRRIVDLRWSPADEKLAATVLRTSDGRSDIWIANMSGGGESPWSRVTQLDDAMAAAWLDESELLVHTTGGLVATVKAAGLNQVRPLTGLTGGSPYVGDDGRVYFLAGRASTGPSDADPMVLVLGSLWSVLADGSDARRERELPAEPLRLDGRWSENALLVHRGSTSTQSLLVGNAFVDFPTNAGSIERVRLAADKRTALGFTSTKVLRLDLSLRAERPTITVLLDGIADADMWYPSTLRVARAEPVTSPSAPKARYAFTLAGSLWTMGSDGVPVLLRTASESANTLRRTQIPLPLWSPQGDRLLTTEFGAITASQVSLGAVVLGRNGEVTKLAALGAVTRAPAWSPDGRTVAAITPAAGTNTTIADELVVRFGAVDGSSVQTPVPGREVTWSPAGLFVISNGTFNPETRTRSSVSVERVDGTARRPLATLSALLGDARAQVPATGAQNPALGELTASPDGAFVSVRLAYGTGQSAPMRLLLITLRTSDGRATVYLPGDGALDPTWSPTSSHLGYSAPATTGTQPRPMTATVIDAVTGASISRADGRFAGWSPDGGWYYVARDTGLYAIKLGTTETVRISPIGVPVSVTAP